MNHCLWAIVDQWSTILFFPLLAGGLKKSYGAEGRAFKYSYQGKMESYFNRAKATFFSLEAGIIFHHHFFFFSFFNPMVRLNVPLQPEVLLLLLYFFAN